MTKRPSPFEPSISRQSKIHFNNFENDVLAHKEMEERTLKKLVDGSKKLHSIILNNGDHFQTENGMNVKCNLMQTSVTHYFTVNGKKINGNVSFLNSSTSFLQYYFSYNKQFGVNGKHWFSVEIPNPAEGSGDRVIIPSFEMPSRCFFCETRTNSVYQCSRCLEVYCSACSFVNYESSEDKRICLSCS